MFLHNYLSVNGIVSFPSFTCLYKQGEMYKGKWIYVCFSLGIARQRVRDSSAETNNEELLTRQPFRNHGYIDGVCYKLKATDNFAAGARKQDNELGLEYRRLQKFSRRRINAV
jgi:hypothetical protein